MAIQDPNAGPGISQQSASPSGQRPQGWSFGDGGLIQSPIPKGIGSEYYNKIKEKLVELYKLATPEVEIKVLDLSRAVDQDLYFSCMLVAVRLTSNQKVGVAVHTLLLAQTGEEIPVIMDTIYDRQVSIHRVPSDAIDDTLIEKARRLVARDYPHARIYLVDATVVPASFNPDDKFLMQELAMNSAMAGVNELQQRTDGFQDLNLALLNKGNQSTVDVDFRRQQVLDVVGMPIRSDIQITFSDRKSIDPRTSRDLNTGDRQSKFSQIDSFCDVVWYPAAETGGFGNVFQPQGQMNTQKFLARQVITGLRASYAQTPAAVALALVTALSLRPPAHWIQAFRPVATKRNEIDLTDIGALNIEGNLPVPNGVGGSSPDPSGFGKVIDTKGEDFRADQLGMLVKALFHSDLILSIDVPEYGPSTQYLSLFSAAAKGSDNAYRRVVDAANTLTDGAFGRVFQIGTPIFTGVTERIHAGTWTDNMGNVRDIRDFDYTAVANLVGAKQPQFLRDWSDTFLRLDYPEPLRLEQRRKMLMTLSGETFKHTGYYQRLTFTKDFVLALDQAIAAQNLQVSVRTPMSGGDFYNQRGVASYATAALLGNGPSFMRQGGFATTANPAAYSGRPSFRYG